MNELDWTCISRWDVSDTNRCLSRTTIFAIQ